MKPPASFAHNRTLFRPRAVRRFFSALCLAAATMSAAAAQCYQFSSSASGVTLKVDITSTVSKIGPISLGGGGRSITYVFIGNYTLTVGQSTQVSAGMGGGSSILYSGTPLFTTVNFTLGDPNFQSDWIVNLQGSGDLLPNGLPQTLPALSKWMLPGLGTHNDYIAIGSTGNTKFYTIDQISGCTTAGQPTISLSVPDLVFSYTEGGALPAPQTVAITNSGTGTLSWSASANMPWIVLSETSNTLTVSINPVGLAAGPHVGAITITAPGATNSPIAIPVEFTINAAAPPVISPATHFVPLTPCRVVDTRNPSSAFGGPAIAGGSSRDFPIPNSLCGIPSTAAAYSLNVAVVPKAHLGYITVWPAGQSQPFVATLNSLDGRIKSNAAIVPAGVNGAISIYATDTTDVILDINGYFVPGPASSATAFYPLTPCRVADTRNAVGPLGGPGLTARTTRTFPIAESACGVPANAQAYSLNFAAIPRGPLGYLTAWPSGKPQPLVASLNALTGTITANAVIVPAGTGQAVDVFTTNDTDLVIDINGYFAPQGPGGLALYAMTPCRVWDSRQPSGTPPFSKAVNLSVTSSPCDLPGTAQAFVFNATVVPPGPFGFLTMWPEGEPQPLAATLNALDGAITNNMAIVPTTNGSITVFGSNPTHLVLDLFGFFAP
ncbi:MAG: hypothetical protein LAP39_09205 [Acidobacteriia bacterium]|nr:hypothetical protein [Terriglobia bacterium]